MDNDKVLLLVTLIGVLMFAGGVGLGIRLAEDSKETEETQEVNWNELSARRPVGEKWHDKDGTCYQWRGNHWGSCEWQKEPLVGELKFDVSKSEVYIYKGWVKLVEEDLDERP